MVFTDAGLDEVALIIGGAGTIPTHIAIGTGSSTLSSGDTSLQTETDRNSITSYDSSVVGDMTYIANFGKNEISGTTLTEFGLFNSSSGAAMFDRQVIGSIAFDGSNELQIQLTLRPIQA